MQLDPKAYLNDYRLKILIKTFALMSFHIFVHFRSWIYSAVVF